jgi:hypothetical protein
LTRNRQISTAEPVTSTSTEADRVAALAVAAIAAAEAWRTMPNAKAGDARDPGAAGCG